MDISINGTKLRCFCIMFMMQKEIVFPSEYNTFKKKQPLNSESKTNDLLRIFILYVQSDSISILLSFCNTNSLLSFRRKPMGEKEQC